MTRFCPFTKEWCEPDCKLHGSDGKCGLSHSELSKTVSALDDSVMVLVEELRNLRNDIWNMVHDNGRYDNMDQD